MSDENVTFDHWVESVKKYLKNAEFKKLGKNEQEFYNTAKAAIESYELSINTINQTLNEASDER